MYCLQRCCYYSLSKSIEFVKFINCFRCLVINSCLFIGQIPCFEVSLFSVSLGCCRRMQRYIRRSVVCSSVPQGHVALSSSLNRCRQALVLPCPVTRTLKLGVTFILVLILSEMLGKNCLVRAAFGFSSHAFAILLSFRRLILCILCSCVFCCM